MVAGSNSDAAIYQDGHTARECCTGRRLEGASRCSAAGKLRRRSGETWAAREELAEIMTVCPWRVKEYAYPTVREAGGRQTTASEQRNGAW